MKFRVLFLLALLGLTSSWVSAQTARGVRIGYIDTEYILQNVPEYTEAAAQLDKKALEWKSEIEQKLATVEQKKKELENESVLLTKELYEERFEEISFEEAEILDYQQKRFGPQGDFMIQKQQLIQPVQDQIFVAVQQIATTKKFDFVFDKAADLTMLYSAERYDISEQVLRTINRTSKRKQVRDKSERKALEDEEIVPVVDTEKEEKQQLLDDRKAQREKELEERRAERERQLEERRKEREALREAKKREFEERRKKAQEAREARRTGNTTEDVKNETEKTEENEETTDMKSEAQQESKDGKEVENKENTADLDEKAKDSTATVIEKPKSNKPKSSAELLEEKRQKKLKDREARKKALEERKKRILEQRRKAREEREALVRKNDSIAKAEKENKNN